MIGEIIRKLRTEAGYTQNELAQKLNVSQSSIGMYEQNRRLPDVENIITLSKIFNVSTDYILGIDHNLEMYKTNISFYPELRDMQSAFVKKFLVLYCQHNLNYETEESFFGLSHKNIDEIKSIRMPDYIELKRVSYAFHVSISYLLGLNEFMVSEDEQDLLEYYRKLDKDEKHIILGNIVTLMKQADSQYSYNNLNLVADTTMKYNSKLDSGNI